MKIAGFGTRGAKPVPYSSGPNLVPDALQNAGLGIRPGCRRAFIALQSNLQDRETQTEPSEK